MRRAHDAALDAYGPLAGARVGSGASATLRAEGLSFGGMIAAESERASVEGPWGARECSCALWGEPAGDYAFRVGGPGPAVTFSSVMLGFADVRPPSGP